MSRRHPDRPRGVHVSAEDVERARARAGELAAVVTALEDSSTPSQRWEDQHAAATAQAQAAERRAASAARLFDELQQRKDDRVKRAKGAARELRGQAVALDASAGQVNAALKDLAKSAAAVVTAASGHNQLVTSTRARLADLGLYVADDTGSYDEGADDQGAMLAGKLRAPVDPAAALMAVIVGVFKRHNPNHPLARTHLQTWRLEAAGLDLAGPAGVDVPRVPEPARADRPSLAEILAAEAAEMRAAEARA